MTKTLSFLSSFFPIFHSLLSPPNWRRFLGDYGNSTGTTGIIIKSNFKVGLYGPKLDQVHTWRLDESQPARVHQLITNRETHFFFFLIRKGKHSKGLINVLSNRSCPCSFVKSSFESDLLHKQTKFKFFFLMLVNLSNQVPTSYWLARSSKNVQKILATRDRIVIGLI